MPTLTYCLRGKKKGQGSGVPECEADDHVDSEATGSVQSLPVTLTRGAGPMHLSLQWASAAVSIKWVHEDLFHWVVMTVKQANPAASTLKVEIAVANFLGGKGQGVMGLFPKGDLDPSLVPFSPIVHILTQLPQLPGFLQRPDH